ncbi:MAG: hypothetical protein SFU99_03925 [Saprospiraceae bacterium]|nr:hypothetical protein [Saprospiraceae bacterium]
MPASTDVGLTPNSTQNEFINTMNQFFGTLSTGAQGLASAYSTFIGARTTAQLAANQGSQASQTPTNSDLNAISTQRTKTAITYAGIAIAGFLTVMIAYKALK